MNQNGNVAVQKPANLSLSVKKRAGFLLEVLRVQGLENRVEQMLDGKVDFPETFTRPQMHQIALEAGDEWFIKYFRKQKTGRGLRDLAADTGKSVAYYDNLMDNPPSVARFGEKIVKSTNFTCKSVQDGVMFYPKSHCAPDGTIHYRTDWLIDALRTADVKLGRAAMLATCARVNLAPTEQGEVVEQNNEDQSDD